MKVKSISRKLLTRVLSVYFILTFIVTCGQIVAEYFNAKQSIMNELLTLEQTFSGSLTRAVWELNPKQAIDIAKGLVAIPTIKAISITDESGDVIAQLGDFPAALINASPVTLETMNHELIESNYHGYFGQSLPLIFEFSGRTTNVGTITLLSNNEVIINRIKFGIYFLVANAIAKTAFLVFLFSMAFSKMLTTPLNHMTKQINQFDIDDPEASKVHAVSRHHNELFVLQSAYNNLIEQLVVYKSKLSATQQELIDANSKLDEHNLLLEQEVAKKASSLSNTLLEMERQQRELMKQQEKLKEENARRRNTESILVKTNADLQASVLELKKAQDMLLRTEKLAALGGLSAEISHEINTPIGISITSTSYLYDLFNELNQHIEQKTLSKKLLKEMMLNAKNSLELLLNNLHRASDLIASFKQVAVDQSSDKIRRINMAHYIDEIIQSLHPKLKKTNHHINVSCATDINVVTHPGAISQIITNLVINSIIHGFEHKNRGEISIKVSVHHHIIKLIYKDNGVGLTSEQKSHFFDPFYTTKADKGGSGLGTHIIRNLVVNTLNGTIELQSEPDQGIEITIEFPSMDQVMSSH